MNTYTKKELIMNLEKSRENLLEALEGIPFDFANKAVGEPNWSIRGILLHISLWEAELVKLLWQAKQGTQPTTLHFSNKPFDEINNTWIDQNQERDYYLILDDLKGVRTQTLKRLEGFSDKDLFTENRYPWLKNTALEKVIAETTYLHEIEHTEEILRLRKEWGYLIDLI